MELHSGVCHLKIILHCWTLCLGSLLLRTAPTGPETERESYRKRRMLMTDRGWRRQRHCWWIVEVYQELFCLLSAGRLAAWMTKPLLKQGDTSGLHWDHFKSYLSVCWCLVSFNLCERHVAIVSPLFVISSSSIKQNKSCQPSFTVHSQVKVKSSCFSVHTLLSGF